MSVEQWPFLLILLIIPILHRWWVNRNRPASLRFSLPVEEGGRKTNPIKWLLLWRYLGLVLIVFALARPQEAYRVSYRSVTGIDIMFVMDVSDSMNIEDLAEKSRLAVAKDTLRSFIRGRSNDRIGFVVFSGEAVTVAPLTLDYGLVLTAIRDADTGRLKDGTAIGDGLTVGVSRLKNSKSKSKVLILLTDGDNNVGQVDPATAGELAAGYGIRTYTIAIGREGRVKLPRKQRIGSRTITTYQWFENALNPELLKKIAGMTDGKFYRVTDLDTLDAVFKEIDQLEKTEVKTTERLKFSERFQLPLKLGIFFLLFEKILALGWWRWLP